MSALEQEWPDEDRRHEALVWALCDTYRAEEEPELSPSEVRVVEALSHGVGQAGAAEILGLSQHTVNAHMKRISPKLRAKNTTHACCEALRRGLIR